MPNSTLTEKQQYWLNHCTDYESFSGSQKEYALAHGLKLTDFYGWRKILREKGLIKPIAKKREVLTKPRFSRVQVDSTLHVAAQVQIRTQQITLSLQCLPEPNWLADFLLALESRP